MQVYSTDFQGILISCELDTQNPRFDSPVFFENKALLGKTKHIRFLVLPIPIYVQNMKERNFSTPAAKARCLLKVALKVDFQSVLRRLSPELFVSLTWWNVVFATTKKTEIIYEIESMFGSVRKFFHMEKKIDFNISSFSEESSCNTPCVHPQACGSSCSMATGCAELLGHYYTGRHFFLFPVNKTQYMYTPRYYLVLAARPPQSLFLQFHRE